MQAAALGYICQDRVCTLDKYDLNDTSGTWIVVGMICMLIMSFHWALFYLVVGSLEALAYSAYFIET